MLGLQTNGTRVTRIDSQGVGTEVTSLNNRLPVESFTYGNNLICGKLDNGTTLSSNGTSWSSTSLFPQAGNYGDPYYDEVGRWHICGPAGQPLICYGEDNGSIITWSLVSQEVPSGGSGDAYVAATSGRVIVTQLLADMYLLSGQIDGVYTVDVKLTQTSGEIFSLASPRLIIDNAETQQDANQIFVDRFQNAGNLPLGAKDTGGVWAAGTIGKAIEDISKAEGPAGKGWTGGSYSSSTGIVTFTSNDGLGFTTEDLRGSNGSNGTNGTSVDLTTVSVDTADCSVTPESSNGSFVEDGTGADGTKQYKLDLTLPRPPVVTTSADEPTDACDGDFWIDDSGNGEGNKTDGSLKAYMYRNNVTNVTTAYGISSFTGSGEGAGKYLASFDTPMETTLYTVVCGGAITTDGRVACVFPSTRTVNNVKIYGYPIYGTTAYQSLNQCDIVIIEKDS